MLDHGYHDPRPTSSAREQLQDAAASCRRHAAQNDRDGHYDTAAAYRHAASLIERAIKTNPAQMHFAELLGEADSSHAADASVPNQAAHNK